MSSEYYVQVLMSGYEMIKVITDNKEEAESKAVGYANSHLSKNYTSVDSAEFKTWDELRTWEKRELYIVD